MAIIKKSTNNRCQRKCEEKGKLLLCWWDCKLVQLLWKIVWRFLKKLKIELPYDPATTPLSIYLKKFKTLILHQYLVFPLHSSSNRLLFNFSLPPNSLQDFFKCKLYLLSVCPLDTILSFSSHWAFHNSSLLHE